MTQELNNASGSVFNMAQHVANELRKSGTKAWAGLPSPEEWELLRAEKAEHDFQQLKRRADAHDRRLEGMKQALKRKLQGGTSHE
jgi:hypothetical protein